MSHEVFCHCLFKEVIERMFHKRKLTSMCELKKVFTRIRPRQSPSKNILDIWVNIIIRFSQVRPTTLKFLFEVKTREYQKLFN